MNTFMDFIQNKYIYIPFFLWFGIQLFKLIYDLVTTKKFNFKRIMGAGGMPSSHSKECSKMLESAERKITILLNKDGNVEEEDFEAKE